MGVSMERGVWDRQRGSWGQHPIGREVSLSSPLSFSLLLIFGEFLPWTDGPRGGVEGWPRRGLRAHRQSQGQSQLLLEIQPGGPHPALSAQYKHPSPGGC